jgi:hypothetical protein
MSRPKASRLLYRSLIERLLLSRDGDIKVQSKCRTFSSLVLLVCLRFFFGCKRSRSSQCCQALTQALLLRALRDSDPRVVESAAQAIEPFRSSPHRKVVQAARPPRNVSRMR